jgi:D-glycero-D-manno-heptose 1,7-bisphosphate phosphatase
MGVRRTGRCFEPHVNRAVFLDRDGVINRALVRDGKPYPPASVAELEILQEAPAALAALKQAGFALIVVTNQPDVARGTQSQATIDAMHEKLRSELPLDAIYSCIHDGSDACDCRKPKPGLLLLGAAQHGVTLNESFLIGDRWRDVDAGFAAGVRTVFIDYGYNERGPEHAPDARVKSLKEAVDWILDVAAKPQCRKTALGPQS